MKYLKKHKSVNLNEILKILFEQTGDILNVHLEQDELD